MSNISPYIKRGIVPIFRHLRATGAHERTNSARFLASHAAQHTSTAENGT